MIMQWAYGHDDKRVDDTPREDLADMIDPVYDMGVVERRQREVAAIKIDTSLSKRPCRPPQSLHACDLYGPDVEVYLNGENTPDIWLWVDGERGVGARYVQSGRHLRLERVEGKFEVRWLPEIEEAMRKSFLRSLPIFNLPPEPYNPIREWAQKIRGWFRK